ncbi:CAP domain-containing protein [Bizionia sp. KMM 8389]
MKKVTFIPFMVLLVVFATSCSSESIDDTTASNTNVTNIDTSNLVIPETKIIEIEIMELINDYRLSIGLNGLNTIDIIKSQAFNHTDYMIENNNVSHDNFQERKEFLENSLGADYVSENVAYGFTSAQTVFNAWLNSESHRSNIEGNYSDFDISAEQDANGRWYYTNIFVKK